MKSALLFVNIPSSALRKFGLAELFAFRLFVMSILVFWSTSLSFAQTVYPSAVFNSKTEVVLDSIAPLSEYYEADIGVLGFDTEEEVQEFFNLRTDNLLSYSLDYASRKVIIHLHLNNTEPSWTVTDWNRYANDKFDN